MSDGRATSYRPDELGEFYGAVDGVRADLERIRALRREVRFWVRVQSCVVVVQLIAVVWMATR